MTSERVKGHALFQDGSEFFRGEWAPTHAACQCGAMCDSFQRDAGRAWHRRHKDQVLAEKEKT